MWSRSRFPGSEPCAIRSRTKSPKWSDKPPEPAPHHNNKESIVNMPKHLLPTTVVASYPQPEWLVDRAMLSKVVPRTRMHAMWRLPAEHLEEAQDDTTLGCVRAMERAGLEVVDT